MFRDGDDVEVHKRAKKERGQYPAILTEQTWSIKDLLYGFRGNFACGIQRVVPCSGVFQSVSVFRCSGVPVFRCSGVHGFSTCHSFHHF